MNGSWPEPDDPLAVVPDELVPAVPEELDGFEAVEEEVVPDDVVPDEVELDCEPLPCEVPCEVPWFANGSWYWLSPALCASAEAGKTRTRRLRARAVRRTAQG